MAASSTATTPFVFPRDYHFPPFFTRQTNLNTRHAQLTKWSDLVLSYCRHYRIYKISLGAAISSSAAAATTTGNAGATSAATPTPTSGSVIGIPIYGDPAEAPASATASSPQELFHNKKLNKRLSLADAREVVEFMRKEGRAEYVSGKDAGDVVWVYWRTPEEWAALVEAWVDETGQKGVVLTLYEIVEGDGSKGTDLHGIDQELLLKSLNVLTKRGKAQIFGQEDSQGVKFF